MTERQKQILFPLLRRELLGTERAVLDFGCGPGRFTADLAALIRGEATGVDPIPRLLDFAPRGKNVVYLQMDDQKIPCPSSSFDLAWVVLVLGGITDEALVEAVTELRRVLKPGGLLFLAENTAEKPDAPHWHFRSVGAYSALIPFANLQQVGHYDDLAETITVMAGRTCPMKNPE